MKIEIELDLDAADLIKQKLRQSLQSELAQARNEKIVLVAKSDLNKVVAGLSAETSYGWLLIKSLWVDGCYRRDGLGTSLMTQAESQGRAAGCHAAWLDTSNPLARLFYSKLNYAPFAELSNKRGQVPETHSRWFMVKSL